MLTGLRRVDTTLLAAMAALLLVLPAVTSFDDLLTAWLAQSGLERLVEVAAPVEAKLVAALLRLLAVHAGVSGADISVRDAAGHVTTLTVAWNCVGWQSLLLLGISFGAGLKGNLGWEGRLQVVSIGVLGTVLVNLLRIAAVGLLAAWAGRVPALLFHDYGGTLVVVGWLFAFWACSHRWLLRTAGEEGE